MKMKIGVISDSHGDAPAIQTAINVAGAVDAWIHLGDFSSDTVRMKSMVNVPIYCVKGNCDLMSQEATEKILELAGARILLAHGHTFNVKTTTLNIALQAEKLNCVVALFGHTHYPHMSARGSILILNPGSVSRPIGTSNRSFAILEVKNGDVNAEIITI
ncbi:MAG: metallophosphoesterase [Clostridia bacterium]